MFKVTKWCQPINQIGFLLLDSCVQDVWRLQPIRVLEEGSLTNQSLSDPISPFVTSGDLETLFTSLYWNHDQLIIKNETIKFFNIKNTDQNVKICKFY